MIHVSYNSNDTTAATIKFLVIQKIVCKEAVRTNAAATNLNLQSAGRAWKLLCHRGLCNGFECWTCLVNQVFFDVSRRATRRILANVSGSSFKCFKLRVLAASGSSPQTNTHIP